MMGQKIVIVDVQGALEQLMLHRASRTSYDKADPHYKHVGLQAAGLSLEATLRSMGLDLGDYFKAVQRAAEHEVVERWTDWHPSLLEGTLLDTGPLPGFVMVDVTRGSGVIRNQRVQDLDWKERHGEEAIHSYRIAAHPDNFWYERNRMYRAWSDAPCEPDWMDTPPKRQRVRIRYGSPYLGDKQSTNNYAYWNDGWINRFGQTLYNIDAWQPLSAEEAAKPVEAYLG